MAKKTKTEKTVLTISLKRTGIIFTDQKEIQGKRGILTVKNKKYPTVEKLKVPRPLPKSGNFECEMGFITFPSGKKRKAVRISGFGRRYYVHAANFPHELRGCVAPGMSVIKYGVKNSNKAMKQILKSLGEFETGKKVKLIIS